jgi:predicted HD phosphohydrolase
MSEQRYQVSDEAIACLAHGVGHLMEDLGEEQGLRMAAEILDSLAEADGSIFDHEDLEARDESRVRV